MPDMLEVVLDRNGQVAVLTKTICRPPGFFVHDFLRQRTGCYPLVNLESKTKFSDLAKRVPILMKSDFNNLDAHCLIVENAGALRLEGDTLTMYDPARFNKLVGWGKKSDGQYELIIKIEDGKFVGAPFPPL